MDPRWPNIDSKFVLHLIIADPTLNLVGRILDPHWPNKRVNTVGPILTLCWRQFLHQLHGSKAQFYCGLSLAQLFLANYGPPYCVDINIYRDILICIRMYMERVTSEQILRHHVRNDALAVIG